MACGTSEKMPIEVSAKEKVSAQNGHSRMASPTVGPGLSEIRAGTRPGAPRSMRRHGRNSSSGMNTALAQANTI